MNFALKDRQVEYQPTMVEFEGKICNHVASILIDPEESMSYISPKLVKSCHLQVSKFKNLWSVQLATGEERRVIEKVEDYPIELVGQPIKVNINIFPLCSYDVLIGMNWLEKHWSLVNCKSKTISFTDEGGSRKDI